LREAIKLILNSYTGKTVENKMKYVEINDFEDDYEDEEDEVTEPDNIVRINGFRKVIEPSKSHINEYLHVGLMIYDFSKRMLFDYMFCTPGGPDSNISTETDGIANLAELKEQFIANIKTRMTPDKPWFGYGKLLGNIEQDKISVEGFPSYFMGKKMYAYMVEKKGKLSPLMRLKGIPGTILEDDGTKVDLIKFEDYEKLYRGEDVLYNYRTFKRNIFEDVYVARCDVHRTVRSHEMIKIKKC
jgi:hypothetical protein